MRTTLTLEPDVAQRVEDEMHRQRKSLKQVINEALRDGFKRKRGKPARYVVEPHRSALLPGIDSLRFNALADELEAEAVVQQLKRTRRRAL